MFIRAKYVVNEDTLLPMMFIGLRELGNVRKSAEQAKSSSMVLTELQLYLACSIVRRTKSTIVYVSIVLLTDHPH